jgi:hypothetical protein
VTSTDDRHTHTSGLLGENFPGEARRGGHIPRMGGRRAARPATGATGPGRLPSALSAIFYSIRPFKVPIVVGRASG